MDKKAIKLDDTEIETQKHRTEQLYLIRSL